MNLYASLVFSASRISSASSFAPVHDDPHRRHGGFRCWHRRTFFYNRNDLAAGYYSLAAAPETEYLLGFVPGKEKFNGKFHKLKVAVNLPGKLYVQARPGYFAPSKEAQENASQPTPEEQIDAEV